MTKTDKPRLNLLVYFFISLLMLAVAGLLFKGVFAFYNDSQFAALSFSDILYALFWGLRFDFAAAALFTLVSCFILWFYSRFLLHFSPCFSSRSPPAFLLLGFMLFVQMSLQIGDAVYFVEAGRHVSYEMRDALTDASGLFLTAVTKHSGFILLSYLLAFAVILALLKAAKKITLFLNGRFVIPVFPLQSEASLLVVILLSVIIVRGGVTGLPQSVISAFKIGNAQQAIITMNGAYSVVYGALNSGKEITRLNIVLPDDVDVTAGMKLLYPVLPDFSQSVTAVKSAAIKQYNVIFILLEGWSADGMSAYGYEVETTPFYASLKPKSMTPLGAIAGGVRTTEGLYATFCSQQNPLGKTVAQTSLQNHQYRCLPDILKRYGWHTAFFQGTHKETSGTGAFAQSLGFSQSFAKEDFPEGRYKHNFWGAHDPDIYDFVLDTLETMPQPFLIGVNTNSTHDSRMPEGVPAFFGDGDSDQKRQSIMRFADQSMKEFFDKIKHKPYYKNTIFVLMSDHTGGKHNTTAARYFIPAIIYNEDLIPAEKINRYVSQRDFSPTILDILGLPVSPSFEGKSFLHENDAASGQSPHFADYFNAGSIGWLHENILVETSVTNPSAIKCYDIEAGLLAASAVSCSEAHKISSINSLLFTSYSQQLLFTGNTKNFYGFYE